MLRVGLVAVKRAPGGKGAADRLRGDQPAVRVPEAGVVREVLDPALRVRVGIVGAVDQRRREAAGAGRRGEDEVERRSALRLEQLVGVAARLELEAAPVGVGDATDRLRARACRRSGTRGRGGPSARSGARAGDPAPRPARAGGRRRAAAGPRAGRRRRAAHRRSARAEGSARPSRPTPPAGARRGPRRTGRSAPRRDRRSRRPTRRRSRRSRRRRPLETRRWRQAVTSAAAAPASNAPSDAPPESVSDRRRGFRAIRPLPRRALATGLREKY